MNDHLPVNWIRVSVGAFCSIRNGIAFSTNDVVDKDKPGSIACFRTSNIQEELDTSDVTYVPERLVRERDYSLRIGDLLVSTANSNTLVGKCCLVRELDEPSLYGGFISRVRIESELLDREFAYLWLSSNAVQAYLRQRARQTTNIANLPPTDVLTTPIVVPPLSEQRRIVEILNEARDIRRLRQHADDLTTQLIPAIFDEMFGDPIGEDPSVDRTPVSDFVAEMRGGKSLGEDPSGTRHRVVKVSAVTWGKFQPDESKYVDDNYVPPDDHFVRKGDMLFSRANTVELVGATVLVEESYPDILLSDKIWRFVWKNPQQVDPHYMLALFQHPSVRREMSNNATGTGGSMKNISKGKLMDIRVTLAHHEDQRKFGDTVREISSLYLDERDYNVLMQSLLAYAFSGELTADWREANRNQLAQEAEERDQWLLEHGVKLTIPNTQIRDFLKKTDGRHEELNREQRKLLEQIQNLDPNENGGTFTLTSLLPLDEPLDKLTAESARRHLDVLAARGLIKAISRRAGAGGSVNVAFGNVYRVPLREEDITGTADEPDYARMSELDRLAKLGRVIRESVSDTLTVKQMIEGDAWDDHTQAPDTEE